MDSSRWSINGYLCALAHVRREKREAVMAIEAAVLPLMPKAKAASGLGP